MNRHTKSPFIHGATFSVLSLPSLLLSLLTRFSCVQDMIKFFFSYNDIVYKANSNRDPSCRHTFYHRGLLTSNQHVQGYISFMLRCPELAPNHCECHFLTQGAPSSFYDFMHRELACFFLTKSLFLVFCKQTICLHTLPSRLYH